LSSDDEDDPQLRADVHGASLLSLSSIAGRVQTVIIENINPPPGLKSTASVLIFTGSGGQSRAGFYPTG
jgi:hypothetical protein